MTIKNCFNSVFKCLEELKSDIKEIDLNENTSSPVDRKQQEIRVSSVACRIIGIVSVATCAAIGFVGLALTPISPIFPLVALPICAVITVIAHDFLVIGNNLHQLVSVDQPNTPKDFVDLVSHGLDIGKKVVQESFGERNQVACKGTWVAKGLLDLFEVDLELLRV